jgi:hypothetical protein
MVQTVTGNLLEILSAMRIEIFKGVKKVDPKLYLLKKVEPKRLAHLAPPFSKVEKVDLNCLLHFLHCLKEPS